MRVTILAALLASAVPIPARAQTVKPASPALNAQAEQRLRGLFAARNEADTQHLFSAGSLICGPLLWKNLRTVPGLDKKGADFRFYANLAPGADGKKSISGGVGGRMFNTKDSIAAVRTGFLGLYPPDPKARTRKLKPAELKLFASMLPFPPEEPLFVVESGGHKFVVRLDDKVRIAWIDDYQHID
jgi:hypothetical protein